MSDIETQPAPEEPVAPQPEPAAPGEPAPKPEPAAQPEPPMTMKAEISEAPRVDEHIHVKETSHSEKFRDTSYEEKPSYKEKSSGKIPKQSRREREIGEEEKYRPYVQDLDDFEIDRDFTSRLINTAIGGGSPYYQRGDGDVRDNIYTYTASLHNRPETLVNPNLSRRSKKVIREGYDLGFHAPGLKLLFEVKLHLLFVPMSCF